MTDEELWKNETFLAWFKDRPANVQAVVRRVPPHKKYCVQGGALPGVIYSYGEDDDKLVTITALINDPLDPRRVFGLSESDLVPWDESIHGNALKDLLES